MQVFLSLSGNLETLVQDGGYLNIPWSNLLTLEIRKVRPREVPQLINKTSVPRLPGLWGERSSLCL